PPPGDGDRVTDGASIVPRRSQRARPSNQAARANRGCATILLRSATRGPEGASPPRSWAGFRHGSQRACARARAQTEGSASVLTRQHARTGRERGTAGCARERSAARAGGAAAAAGAASGRGGKRGGVTDKDA